MVVCAGDAVWLEGGADCYHKAVVSAVRDQEVEVKDGAKVIVVPKSNLMLVNTLPANGVQDNTELTYLHDASLLNNIRLRYGHDDIHTFTAHILVVVNPYKRLPLYSTDMMLKYAGVPIGRLPPHVFAVADRAYRSMKAQKADQILVVSGESGAGKTETCKFAMRYFAHVGSSRDEFGHLGTLEMKVLQVNPLLESFGNAKTLRNNNSSRFGKFTEMRFNSASKLVGASVETHLLEKPRVVSPENGERSYHVFYQLLAGSDTAEKKRYGLDKFKTYKYMSNGGCLAINGVDDAKDFGELKEGMLTVGFSPEECDQVFIITAAVMHIGNVVFAGQRSRAGCSVDASTEDCLKEFSRLLELDYPRVEKGLTTRTMIVGGKANTGLKSTKKQETMTVPLSPQEAEYARDALGKHIYTRALFPWIIEVVNRCLPRDESATTLIGVLDIAGFEVFEKNGFEQLCINHINEQLQQYFNKQILMQEQHIYEMEALRYRKVEFRDNTETIELVEDRRIGILALLDEECVFPNATDKTFCEKVLKMNETCKSLQTVPRKGRLKDNEGFIIVHFAGPVTYDVDGFLDKNNDQLHDSLMEVLENCKMPAFNIAESVISSPTTPNKRSKSVSSRFRVQLAHLLKRLNESPSHFIRCIKPNSQQVSGVFDSAMVMAQLRCSGMCAAVQLMQAGFPTRCSFDTLFERYSKFMPPVIARLKPSLFCEAILVALNLSGDKDFQIGLTKVFFRPGKMAILEDLIGDGAESKMQDVVGRVKSWLAKRRFHMAMHAIVACSRLRRILMRHRALRLFCKMVRVTVLIQKTWYPALDRARVKLRRLRALKWFVRIAKLVMTVKRVLVRGALVRARARLARIRKFRRMVRIVVRMQRVWVKRALPLARRRIADRLRKAEIAQALGKFVLAVKVARVYRRSLHRSLVRARKVIHDRKLASMEKAAREALEKAEAEAARVAAAAAEVERKKQAKLAEEAAKLAAIEQEKKDKQAAKEAKAAEAERLKEEKRLKKENKGKSKGATMTAENDENDDEDKSSSTVATPTRIVSVTRVTPASGPNTPTNDTVAQLNGDDDDEDAASAVQRAMGLQLSAKKGPSLSNTSVRATSNHDALERGLSSLAGKVDELEPLPTNGATVDVKKAEEHYSMAYEHFTKRSGSRRENLELAVYHFQWALQLMPRDVNPETWANVHNSLAMSFQEREMGDHGQNIEKAIKHFHHALEVYTREQYPELWSMAQINLAIAYTDRTQGDQSENQEEAIHRFDASMLVRTKEKDPLWWAALQINISKLYRVRIKGDRAENIELVILGCTQALKVYTRDKHPEDWAATLNNLASAYQERIKGSRAENVEDVIRYCNMSLEVRTRKTNPLKWAATQNNLAAAYQERIRGDHNENIEEAIRRCELALQVFTMRDNPDDWASTMNNLASAYHQRKRGEPAENIEQAIECCNHALMVRTRDRNPRKWAATVNNIAAAYQDRLRGDRAENLEMACKCYRATLDVYTREYDPENWAATQNNLSIVFEERLRGDRAENQEESIRRCELSLQVRTKQSHPEKWALTQNNLAAAYQVRIRGERSANLEESIKRYRLALEVFSRDNFPDKWVMTSNNLALVYMARLEGAKFENLKLSVRYFLEALEGFGPGPTTEFAAMIHFNLGNAYAAWMDDNVEQHCDDAVKHYKIAYKIFTKERSPEQWATIQERVGFLFLDRPRDKKDQHVEEAIKRLENAAEVRFPILFPKQPKVKKGFLSSPSTATVVTTPASSAGNAAKAFRNRMLGALADGDASKSGSTEVDHVEATRRYQATLEQETVVQEEQKRAWGVLCNRLADAYYVRKKGKPSDNRKIAIQRRQDALKVFSKDRTPAAFVETSYSLGLQLVDMGLDAEAVEVWDAALNAVETVLLLARVAPNAAGDGVGEMDAAETTNSHSVLLNVNLYHMYSLTVAACIRLEKIETAWTFMERCSARRLVETVAKQQIRPRMPEDVADEYDALVAGIAKQVENVQLGSRDLREPLTLSMRAPVQRLEDFIAVHDPDFAAARSVRRVAIQDVRKVLPHAACIEWFLGERTASAVLLFGDAPARALNLKADSGQILTAAIRLRTATVACDESAIQQSLQDLAKLLEVDMIVTACSGARELVLVPHRALFAVPLHALPLSNGKRLLDVVPSGVRYAPNLQVMAWKHRRTVARNSTSSPAWTPLTSLVGDASAETALVGTLFAADQVRQFSSAQSSGEELVKEVSRRTATLHLACPLIVKSEDPMAWFVELVDKEEFTVADLFGQLRLPATKLCVLSCGAVPLPSKIVCNEPCLFPLAFLYCGADVVLSTLWSVDAATKLLFFGHFYPLLKADSTCTVASALAQTEMWLRMLSLDDALPLLKASLGASEADAEIAKVSARGQLPFSHPFYWSAFVTYG